MASDFRPGSFQILPVIIKNLLIINGLVWLAQISVGKSLFSFENLFALHHPKSEFYHFWQIITYMFLHSPTDFFHLLFNMFGLWMFGSTLENLWGPGRFLVFYLVCGFVAGLAHIGAITWEMLQVQHAAMAEQLNPEPYLRQVANVPMMGASGGVMGVLAAFAYTFPNDRLFIFPIPFPIKVKWAILGLVAFDLFNGLTGRDPSVAHFAHLGGAAAGIILVIIWNKRNRRTFY